VRPNESVRDFEPMTFVIENDDRSYAVTVTSHYNFVWHHGKVYGTSSAPQQSPVICYLKE